nr:MAG TPA: hypothetical protein [Caudoviricetes sp.]
MCEVTTPHGCAPIGGVGYFSKLLLHIHLVYSI